MTHLTTVHTEDHAPVPHTHAWRGLQVSCADLTHCPSHCPCPLGECDATTV